MRVLLDTHVLIWFYEGSLSQKNRDLIENSQAYVSVISLWEIEIKRSLGKLEIKGEIYQQFEKSPFLLLGISLPHIRQVGTLPFHHRDPFDRMLVAQAQVEGLKLLTDDKRLSAYDAVLL